MTKMATQQRMYWHHWVITWYNAIHCWYYKSWGNICDRHKLCLQEGKWNHIQNTGYLDFVFMWGITETFH